MTKRRFEKQVAIKATDDEERIATGLVLRPNVLDRQLDFFERDGIEAMFNPNPNDGVMHAAFPEGHAELVRNEVLESDETIDGVEFSAGDWVIRRKYHDEQRYQLVKDGVLGGFSMGGHITEETRFESIDELPDTVEIPDAVDPEAVRGTEHWPPARAENGAVEEISDVDVPAVPDAEMASVKAARLKNILERAPDEEAFVEVMLERGHDEADARALYAYLTDAAQDTTMTDEEITAMDDATLGKRLKRLLFGTEPDDAAKVEVPDADVGDAIDAATKALKEGRPLNASNRAALMAAHDAIEATLASDIDFETNRFTDNENVDFSIEEFGKADDIASMTDDDTTTDDGVDVKELADRVESLTSTVAQINEKLDDEDADEKSAEEQVAELEEKLNEQEAELEETRERLDKLSSSTADTSQADGVEDGQEKTDEEPGLDSPDMAAKLFGIPVEGN